MLIGLSLQMFPDQSNYKSCSSV